MLHWYSDDDANFVATGGTAGCHSDNPVPPSDDKVGIMTTLGFQGVI